MVTDNGATTTTAYTGGAVYENSSLKFIHHSEGYIEPDGAGGYDYVYQYKDIWGNARITYSDANNDGSVGSSEIRREQNYYPFGLEHWGYNSSITGVKNNLNTYQGQEFTEDLGLNTHEWKYRISDPTIGRFWQIDPLAEDYTYNSTYAFQENKLGLGTELEGLELNPFHKARRNITENYSAAGQVAIGFLIGGANAVNNTAQGIVDAVSDPVGTVQAIGNAIANPFDTGAAIGAAVEAKVDQAVNGDILDKGIVAGEATIAVAEALVGTKGLGKIGKVDNVSGVSPNVQKALNTLDEIKADGGQVKINNLTSSSQELNMTVTKGSQKMDVRVETHVVPKKYGGNGKTPERHLNVDLYPKKSNPLPNKGHKILEEQ